LAVVSDRRKQQAAKPLGQVADHLVQELLRGGTEGGGKFGLNVGTRAVADWFAGGGPGPAFGTHVPYNAELLTAIDFTAESMRTTSAVAGPLSPWPQWSKHHCRPFGKQSCRRNRSAR